MVAGLDPVTGPSPGGRAAFEASPAIRHRLLEALEGSAFGRAPHLAAIAAPFEVILIDAYSVLNDGETPILGAAARIIELREMGKRMMVVLNSAGYSKRAMM